MMKHTDVIERMITYMNSGDVSEEAFNEHALFLFTYQFTHNKVYQKYCRQKGKTLRNVKDWKSIPAVPVDAFKQLPLTCTPIEEAEAIFMTSGSTSGVPGKHYHHSLEVYDRSMILNFAEHVMKDRGKIRMAIVYPTVEAMPNSSLAHYLGLAKREFGREDSAYCFDEDGIDSEKLFTMLREAEDSQEPLFILGASYSFVHLFEMLDEADLTFSLPEGSMIFDTGGYKNQSEELDLDTFYRLLQEKFGVPREECLNMYGMTELSSQFYDSGNAAVPSRKFGPTWIRSLVVDPLTGEEKKAGEKGILIHYDLANINSVIGIMTEDIGEKEGEGFYLFGRAEGAEAKGCSMALDTFLQATTGGK